MTIPYTYLLHHKPTNTFYYGVRWATGCHPSRFWVSYFTSSRKLVPLLRTLFGDDSFEHEIRRVFDDKFKAREWENKVLRRMRVLEHPEKWLNRTNNYAIYNEVHPNLGRTFSEKARYNMSLAQRNKKLSIETKRKLSKSHMGSRNGFYRKTHNETTKNAIRKANKNRIWNNESRTKISLKMSGSNNPFFGKKHSNKSKLLIQIARSKQVTPTKGRIWVNNGSINQMVFPENIPSGFIKGQK